MAETAEQYLTRTMRAKGVDESTISSYVSSLASNPAAVDELNGIIKRGTDDFNSMQGRVSRADQLIQENLGWKAKFDQEYAQLQQALAAVNNGQQNGNGNGNGAGGGNGTTAYATKADIDAQLAALANRQGNTFKSFGKIISRHSAKFPGDELDVDALEKKAIELSQANGGQMVPLEVAYQAYIAPREKERADAEWAKKLEDAKREAVDAFKSTHHLPADEAPTVQSLLIHGPDKSAGDGAGSDADLVATWRAARK